MFQPASQLATRSLDDYRQFLSGEIYKEIRELTEQLHGARILHINSAPKLGGVVAILNGLVPLLNGLGLHAEWRPLEGLPDDVYAVTKSIHNGLQGHPHNLTAAEWRLFEDFNRNLAQEVNADEWDFIVVHDHQLAPLLQFMPAGKGKAKWLWRSHIDSTQPNEEYLKKFRAYVEPYDALLFSVKDFVFKGLQNDNIVVSPVAIDPLSLKNQPILRTQALAVAKKLGIDARKPIITQVSRFDPWKDHLGVVEAWRMAAKQIPGLQLVLVADFSLRDQQGLRIQKEVLAAVNNHPDAHVFSNQTDNQDVKALVSLSDVVLQKSIREGFGLTVAEAMWAGVPVVGGNVGGIKIQIVDGQTGYLVDTVEQCAEKIVALINNPVMARQMTKAGHEHVKKNFLIPRLLRDDLAVMAAISE